jgi:hypothetical protein
VSGDPFLEQLAEMRREIAELKRRLPTYRAATVTAVDPLASTFAADVPGAGEIVGIPSAPQFLPVVGDEVQLDLFGATPVYRPKRLTTWAATPEGIPYQTTDPGQQYSGTDAAGNTTWQITRDGHQTVRGLSVTEDPIFRGVPLSSQIAPLAQFHAGASRGAEIDPALTPSAGGEVGYYEFTVEMEPGRLYLLLSSNMWIRAGTGTTRVDVNLRYVVSTVRGTDPPAVSLSSPRWARWSEVVSGDIGHGVVLSRLMRETKYAHFRFLLTLHSFGGSAYFEMGSENHTSAALEKTVEVDVVQMAVIDLGAHPWTNRAVTNSGGSTPAAVKRYTYEYYARWTRRFRGDGTVHSDSGDAAQGYTPYYPANGDQASQIGDFRRASTGELLASDLSGATIEKFEVYLYAKWWHYTDGGTGIIRYHNNASPGARNNYAGDVRIGGWARAQGRWVDITTWGALFRDGGAKGIQVGPSGGTDPLFYGYFDGHTGSRPPRIRATFTK